MKHQDDPTGLRFWKTIWLVLREAQIGKRLLCYFGIHRWSHRTYVDRQRDMVYDYQHCRRTPFCRYSHESCVNAEPSAVRFSQL